MGKNACSVMKKEVQNLEEKQWKNEELRNAEEALPRLKECHLRRSVETVQKQKQE